MSIHFDTSGWRAAIADEFTFARTVTTGTPTISHAIRTEKAVCGIHFTSSHNPPQHSGARLSAADRAPALPDVTRKIERLIADSRSESSETGNDPTGAYGTDRRCSGLAAEAVVARGASLTEQLKALYARAGRLENARIGVRITPQLLASLNDKLDRDQNEIGGRRVERTNRMDGVKFIFADGSWLPMRSSGTEPLVRIYAESESATDLEVLLEQGRKYLLG